MERFSTRGLTAILVSPVVSWLDPHRKSSCRSLSISKDQVRYFPSPRICSLLVTLPRTLVYELNTHNTLVLRIPTLAIHLDRQEKFEFNKETQLFPIAGLVAAELNRHGKNEGTTNKDVVANNTGDSFSPLPRAKERHHPHLVCKSQ